MRDLTLRSLEAAAAWAAWAAWALAAVAWASQAGQGRLVLLKRELVSELELLLSLVPVELVPNLLLLNLITLKTSTLSDSSKFESWLRASGSSSRPTGVTREGLPRPGGSYGFTTAEKIII